MSIRKIIWAMRYKRAVRKADRLAKAFGLRYYVILLRGRLMAVPKQTIKRLLRERRFKKGVTIHDIESRALYITK
jgi:hypothetical protein